MNNSQLRRNNRASLIRERSCLLHITKKAYVILRAQWQWDLFGLGFTISIDNDIDDFGFVLFGHLLWLYIEANFSQEHSYTRLAEHNE